jgi:DNA-binding cell septation regulator SpoVG
MPKTKISEFDVDPANNTDINSINIAEGCAPSGINNAIRQLMADLKEFQTGAASDPLTVGGVATFTAGTVSAPAITTAGDTNTGIFFPAADTIAFSEGGTESMRIDSAGNVGIGLSSFAIANRLNVKQSADNSAAGLGLRIERNSNDSSLLVGYRDNTDTWQITATYGTTGAFKPISFLTADAERMRIDSSGNVGIGVTPSAWASGRPAIEANGFALQSYSANYLALSQNTFVNSSLAYIYKTTAAASLYTQISGGHAWFNAPSGTAGNTISFTQAMTLDTSGNLLVGTTSNTFQSGVRCSMNYGGSTWSLGPTASNANNFYVIQGGANGVFVANGANSWSAFSDERIKDIIEPISDAVAKVLTLRAVIGKFKTDKNEKRHAFLIAQDVQAVLPEAVNQQNDEIGTLAVQYTDTIPLLVAAIKEQQAIINDLKSRIENLESK